MDIKKLFPTEVAFDELTDTQLISDLLKESLDICNIVLSRI